MAHLAVGGNDGTFCMECLMPWPCPTWLNQKKERTEGVMYKYVSLPTEERAHMITGVGRDTPTETNENGGKQSAVPYAFDCFDPTAMFEMAKVLKEGKDKYGRDNWRKIPVDDHLNHLLMHIFAYMAADQSDDHMSHIMCRAMFAAGVHYGR